MPIPFTTPTAIAKAAVRSPEFLQVVDTAVELRLPGLVSAAVASYLRDNPVAVLHHHYEVTTKYPWAWWFSLLGAIAGFLTAIIITAKARVTGFADVVDGKSVVVDALSNYAPWQVLFIILVTLSGAGAGAILGSFHKIQTRQIINTQVQDGFRLDFGDTISYDEDLIGETN